MLSYNSFLALSFATMSVLASKPTLAFDRAPSLSKVFAGRENKYLVVNPRGGLGNRLGALVSAYILAELSQRTLVLDWPTAQSNQSHYDQSEMPLLFGEIFTNPIVSVEDVLQSKNTPKIQRQAIEKARDPSTQSFWESLFGLDDLTFLSPQSISHPANYVDDVLNSPNNVVYMSMVVRDFGAAQFHEFSSQKSINDFTQIADFYFEFYDKLRLRPGIQKHIDSFVAQNFQIRSSNTRIVGVHYRSFSAAVGDEEYRISRLGRDFELYPLFVEKMSQVIEQEQAMGNNVYFFVATDDLSVIPLLQQDFGGDKIIAYPHQQVSRNNAKGQRGGVIDFMLLGKTDYIIGSSQSTFSDQAAIMTSEHRKINVGPEIFGSDYIFGAGFVFKYQAFLQAGLGR